METLEHLIKRLDLKPTDTEICCGRTKTRNGYSKVCIYEDNTFITIHPNDTVDFDFNYKLIIIMVRG